MSCFKIGSKENTCTWLRNAGICFMAFVLCSNAASLGVAFATDRIDLDKCHVKTQITKVAKACIAEEEEKAALEKAEDEPAAESAAVCGEDIKEGQNDGTSVAGTITVKAYAYTGGGITATGKPAAVGLVAVDPDIIPLGTKLYIDGYGYAVAADTGGNINGYTMDLYMNTESECINWGARYVSVQILQ